MAASTAAVKSAKPPLQVAPVGVGGHGMLITPCDVSGTLVILYELIVPSASALF
ncbi:MAG: hypothetical protein IPL50_04545 [Chitinophagaceae bacterium]|nr:hypothetical protein [Chitinophagaceae bacterium]